MVKCYHPASSCGLVDLGWIHTYQTFNFRDFKAHDRDRFGALRVLSDSYARRGTGLESHTHNDVEVISIPLKGGFAHQDSLGNHSGIVTGDIHVLSAGTGVLHSEFCTEDDEVNILQLWINPREKGVKPRYQQAVMKTSAPNHWAQILSPSELDDGVWIHQDAWISRTEIKAGKSISYEIKKKENGVYFYLIEGYISIFGKGMTRRDGMGVYHTEEVEISAIEDSILLAIDVPMEHGTE